MGYIFILLYTILYGDFSPKKNRFRVRVRVDNAITYMFKTYISRLMCDFPTNLVGSDNL